MENAVTDLTTKFVYDIDQVVTSQIDLQHLDDDAKVLIVVYATSLLKNLLIRTYFLRQQSALKLSLLKIFASVQ